MKEKRRERTFSAEEARGGEIILTTRVRRAIFIAGLLAPVVLAFLLLVVSNW